MASEAEECEAMAERALVAARETDHLSEIRTQLLLESIAWSNLAVAKRSNVL